MNDKDYLMLAIKEGKKGGERPYGAVIVKNDEILSIEYSHTIETNNPSLHAEVSAIVAACLKEETRHLSNTTLYASHEPCLMCFACAAYAEIDKIVFAISAPQGSYIYRFKGIDIFEMAKKLQRPMQVERVQL